MILTPQPFKDAILHLLEKEQLPAEWDAAEWAQAEPEFRTRAFFISRVENARFLDRAHTLLFDYLAKVRETVTTPDGQTTTALSVSDRSHFIERMREFMVAEGMAKPWEFKDVDQNDLTDIRSTARLRLIFDTTVRQSYGYGDWKQGMSPAVLRAFPAARLIRDRSVKVPRPRHQADLGKVRAKADFAWWAGYHNARKIGGFEVPWGPYGFNSGVTQEDVSKREADALGVDPQDQGDRQPNEMPGFNDGLKASVRKMDPSVKQKLKDALQKRSKGSGRSPEEAAREAARGARQKALERGLARAESRGDGVERDHIRKLMDAEKSRIAIVRDDGDSLSLR